MYMYAGGHGRFDRGKRKIEANRKPKAESRAVILSQGGNTTDRS